MDKNAENTEKIESCFYDYYSLTIIIWIHILTLIAVHYELKCFGIITRRGGKRMFSAPNPSGQNTEI